MKPIGKKAYPNYLGEINQTRVNFFNAVFHLLKENFFFLFPGLRKRARIIKWLVVLSFVFVPLLSWIIFFLQGNISKRSEAPIVSTQINFSPNDLSEAKVLQAMTDKCNTENNFDSNIWDTTSMRVVEKDQDTGEPKLFGAKQDEKEGSFQSLMVYKIPCKLPLTATISAEIRSEISIGLIFEFEDVLQVILGDGDMRSLRYKTHTLEARKYGWEYVYDINDKKITHWISGAIAPGSQVDMTIKLRAAEIDEIEVQVELSYRSVNGSYTTQKFSTVRMKAYNYNLQQNIGKYLRVGINDFLFKGTQSTIKPQRFKVQSGK